MAYNKKVQIQFFTEITDEIGQKVQSWQTIFSPWAEVSGLHGKEYYEASQVNSENTVKFKVRYSKVLVNCLTSELRILYNGRTFDVKHIDDFKEKHLYFVIRAVEHNGRAVT